MEGSSPGENGKVSFHVLKLEALITDVKTGEVFALKFPVSRVGRNFSNLNIVEVLDGFNGRIQAEYNANPVGPYVGPYDQNENLKLNLQL